MFDTLLFVDYLVDDPDALAATFVDRLGLPAPDPEWRRELPDHAVLPYFLRVDRDLGAAPTMIEPLSVSDTANPRDPVFPRYIRSLREFQGEHRPLKVHGTVFTTSRMDELQERLFLRGVPFRIAPSSNEYPGDRIWIGSLPESPDYDPRYDGGAMIEVVTVADVSSQLDPTPQHRERLDPAKNGGLVRVTNRGFLVRDLDAICTLWARNFGFEPTSVTTHEAEGYRRARYEFDVAASSSLDLICPTTPRGDAGRYLLTWGPGAYYTRIGVVDLDAKAQDLETRRTPFDEVPATSAAPRRLAVSPAAVEGAIFEFVQV